MIVTTIIFMISISLHRNETTPQNSAGDDNKSTTISEAEKDTQKEAAEGTETEEKDTGRTDQAGSDKPDSDKTDLSNADKTNSNKENTGSSDEKKPTEDTTGNTKPDSKEDAEDKTASGSQKPSDQETKSNTYQGKKVRFEIKGGEFSDTVCKKLKEAGLIDDAGAFNTYLIQKDYDNLILPGVYDIPKDATYEEIAALLTTKVE